MARNNNTKNNGPNDEPFLSYISADVAANNGNTVAVPGVEEEEEEEMKKSDPEDTQQPVSSNESGSTVAEDPSTSSHPIVPKPLPLYESISSYQAKSCGSSASLNLSAPHSPPPQQQRKRNVSFGNEADAGLQVASSVGGTSSPGRQRNGNTAAAAAGPGGRPPLDRQAISMRLRQTAAAASSRSLMGGGRGTASTTTSGPSSSQPLTVEDIIGHGNGKYETEAETNILAAIEQQQQHQRQHKRDVSTSSSILSSVPEQLLMDLLEADSNHDSKSQMNSVRSDGGTGGDTATSTTHRRQKSNTSAATTSVAASRRQADRIAQRHRRMLSTEDQLAGHVFAMSALDDHNLGLISSSSLRDTGGDDDHTASVSSHSDVDLNADPSAGDLLTHHAGLVLLDGGADSNQQLKPDVGLRQRKNTEVSLPPVLEEVEEGALGQSVSTPPENNSSSLNILGGDVGEGVAQASSESDQDPSSVDEKRDGRQKIRLGKGKRLRRSTVFRNAADKVKEDLDSWQTFFRPHKEQVWRYARRIIFYIIIPLVVIAAILFYFGGNPPSGKAVDRADPGTEPSTSWWLIYTVRQVLTFSMAVATQAFVIDFLCVGTNAMVKLAGPMVTLFIVQGKGWPFVVWAWSLYDFALLYGNNKFARHWLYYQDYIGLFNSENPAGHVVDSDWNRKILLIGVAVSLTTALKRFVVGLYLGRQTFHHFGDQLAKVMNKMVLIAEVATLAKRIRKESVSKDIHTRIQVIEEIMPETYDGNDCKETDNASSTKASDDGLLFDPNNRNPLTGSLSSSEKMKLFQLLERWEEPQRNTSVQNNVSIASVLKFRNALACIKNDYPFGFAFGLAATRESCIESAQEVYGRLTEYRGNNDGSFLQFFTLALIAVRMDGEIDQLKAKELIRVFRPDRQGKLSVLEFVKSVDTVYKELRFLQASIENSSQIDKSFENIVNIVFYAIVFSIILSQLGFDPFSLFLSLSSVVLAFAFAIGSASAKYIEGLLFILVRRPYGIGDLVHVSNIESDTALAGSVGWQVNKITLFETEMTWLPTMERCSISNGSLANSRIINWARSPTARFVIFLMFPIETRYELLETFMVSIEEYLKARPREWLALNAFRVNHLQGEQAWMRIEVVVQHREPWQNVGTVLDSKGNLMSYCAEVQKMLGIQYKAPPMPVDLTLASGTELSAKKPDTFESPQVNDADDISQSDSRQNQAEVFSSMARNRHHIVV
mmetsp:Transcript_57467/g.140251  ORF Transcript_57467/g.140251 Transcript_57467/m.140251 type:complete len:1224 (-) Transcript_57467:76-3747(-)